MYNAEVLGKFPVVQHFPFGSIFNWGSTSRLSSAPPVGAESTSVPISLVHSDNFSDTRPPWAKPGTLPPLNSAPIPPPLVGSRDPMMSDSQQQQQQQPEPPLPELNGPADTRAPWANTARRGPPPATPGSASDMGIVTKAPWAR